MPPVRVRECHAGRRDLQENLVYHLVHVQRIAKARARWRLEIAVHRLVKVSEKELDVAVDLDPPFRQRAGAVRLGEEQVQGIAAGLAFLLCTMR